MEGLWCRAKGVSRLPLAHSRAIVSIRTMSAESHNGAKKVGAVIYLSTNRPLHLPDFLAEFHQSWPHLLPQKTGKAPPAPCSVSASPTSHSNFITRPSRKRLLGPSVHATLHWPEADAVLAGHQAHLLVAESAENRGVLSLACDLTKAIAALLSVTDSLAACWLNGPALNSSKSFVETAREMFGPGLYSLSRCGSPSAGTAKPARSTPKAWLSLARPRFACPNRPMPTR